jgi:type II secretory pathway pseudopilin PulG
MAVWLLSFLIVGVLLGSLMSSALVMRQRAVSASLKRENARLSQRLNKDAKGG